MKGYFFNAQPTTDLASHPSGYDREYDALDYQSVMGAFFDSGVFGNRDSGACKVTANGTALSVAPGVALVAGGQCHFEPGDGLTLTRGDGKYSVMCRRNNAAEAREFQLVALYHASEYPAPVRAGDIYDLCLAHVTVSGGAAAVTDTRADAALCGFAAMAGMPPYYPPDSDSLPYALWLYTLGLPMTDAQRAAVEGNPSLMAIYGDARTRPATAAEVAAAADGVHPVTPATTNGIGAISAAFPVAAGQTIAAGDVVDIVDGAAQKTRVPAIALTGESIVNAQATDNFYVLKLTDNRFVLYTSSPEKKLYLYERVNGTFVLKWLAVEPTGFLNTKSMCRLTDNSFCYERGGGYSTAIVHRYTWDGSAMTTESFSDGGNYDRNRNYQAQCVGIDANHYAQAFQTSGITFCLEVVTLSGTAMTVSTKTFYNNYQGYCAVIVENAQRIHVLYAPDTSDYGKLQDDIYPYANGELSACTSKTVVPAPICGRTYAKMFGAGQCLIYCAEKMFLAQLSNGQFTVVATLADKAREPAGGMDNSCVLQPGETDKFFYYGKYGFVSKIERAGTALVATSKAMYDLTCFEFGGSGTLFIDQHDGPLQSLVYNAGSGEGIKARTFALDKPAARDGVALTAGTAGQSISVAYDGAFSAPWAQAGDIVSGYGDLMAHCPFPGRLDVIGEWKRAVFGTYTGDGTASGLTIDLGFMPRAVLVTKPLNVSYGAALSVPGSMCRSTNPNNVDCLEPVSAGFTVRGSANEHKSTYNYIAWR